ncbi:MAG: bifunctional phosphoribosylaminoimidazolecarboxamide formyltransferase/IMP cyclohydrolase [Alphaproteobacteria bacterium]|nr:bifunctional phosphoribosylaminoimidazolecarboxamide formyltransferase/IMP cyclohydrolase [Alphaproteobacteria bacterium]
MSDAGTVRIRRALVSVSDKAGLAELGAALRRHGVEVISTGGTAQALSAAGVPVREVAEMTGMPEMMGGRVKTLHPKVHGGILARRDDAAHVRDMAAASIQAIDLVVVNLYPFEAAVARRAGDAEAIEQIDIGGPAMIRSAAKNHDAVAVVVEPGDYALLIAELDANAGATGILLRRRLAATAFARTAAYDAAIAGWFQAAGQDPFPARLSLAGERRQTLRYGENPHQSAAFYATAASRPGVATASQVQGKELSYNNLNDTDAAYELVAEFAAPACAIIKHANPCGVATAERLADAYGRALACDPVSAFGGIIALNRPLDMATAERIGTLFAEVIIAPSAAPEALSILARKKDLRILLAGTLPDPRQAGLTFRSIAGGFLAQTRDTAGATAATLRPVTRRQPSAAERADLLFAFTVAKHVKSNAIVYAKDGATVGIGAGQMSRVDSARIAALKAADAARAAGLAASPVVGSVVASDAFFPFADGLLAAAEAGATAVIQPGGSMRDADVIAAADAKGLAMVFTGIRHFRH